MYPEMLENCNKALLSKPKDITALNVKAVALGFLNRYDEALESCDKMPLKIIPNCSVIGYSKKHQKRSIRL
jgi:hypothetical protein